MPSVRLVELPDLFCPEGFPLKERLHGSPSRAHFTLSLGVVAIYPYIQVGLKLLQRLIQLSPEDNLIKLIQNSFVESLTDAICLRMTRFGLRVLNAIHAEIKFIIMGLNLAAVLCASVCQHADESHVH